MFNRKLGGNKFSEEFLRGMKPPKEIFLKKFNSIIC